MGAFLLLASAAQLCQACCVPPPQPPFAHVPVLCAEVLAWARDVSDLRLAVDCTVGGGGHAAALLAALPDLQLLGIDRDPAALAAAAERLAPYGGRASLVHAPFAELPRVLAERDGPRPGFVLADFGVSSHQLDHGPRGFSFRGAAQPLDMRMDPGGGRTAGELLAELDVAALTDAIGSLGEERYARRVARAIKRAQPQDTVALAEVVRGAVPPARDGLDPATRTFQALRMLVNDELGQIGRWLAALPELLADGGIAAAIAFHSLEDRAVKQAFVQAARSCHCPPQLPLCLCQARPSLAVLTRRPQRPDDAEQVRNPRARSARLRAARRLARAA